MNKNASENQKNKQGIDIRFKSEHSKRKQIKRYTSYKIDSYLRPSCSVRCSFGSKIEYRQSFARPQVLSKFVGVFQSSALSLISDQQIHDVKLESEPTVARTLASGKLSHDSQTIEAAATDGFAIRLACEYGSRQQQQQAADSNMKTHLSSDSGFHDHKTVFALSSSLSSACNKDLNNHLQKNDLREHYLDQARMVIVMQKHKKTNRKLFTTLIRQALLLLLLALFALNFINHNLKLKEHDQGAESIVGRHLSDRQQQQRSPWTLVGLFPAVSCIANGFVLKEQQKLRYSNNFTENKKLSHNKVVANKPITKASSGSLSPAAHLSWTTLTNNKRNSHKTFLPQQTSQLDDSPDSLDATGSSNHGLQISITPRVSQIRLPVESNAILKCLISSQTTNKFKKKFDVHWSRYMYDENVYEQLESVSVIDGLNETNERLGSGKNAANKLLLGDSAPPPLSSAPSLNKRSEQLVEKGQPDYTASYNNKPFDRQQQLRDFLARSRQETNLISDLLIEATLSISPVKATDNATYYCTAMDGLNDQNQARIDLVALSKPIVHLERVQPARDSKSALIYWLILSDGNTPIKKTILMVKNDTIVSSGNNLRQQQHQESVIDNNNHQLSTTSSGSQFSSVAIIDSDYNQWQRMDIPSEDEPIGVRPQTATPAGTSYHELAFKTTQSNLGPSNFEDSIVQADVDITSSNQNPLFAGSDNNHNDYYGSSSSRSRWLNSRFNKSQRSFNLSSLLPGVTYNFRLAAINDMGQSNWTYLTATMPNEIPAQINEMFLLSRSNDSLAIGWRRPSYDGAKTIRYEMQLFDLNRTLTLDANTNASATWPRTNFMYIFVNLNPGTDYHFHVRACSKAGCSAFSSAKLLASTLDGESDEPTEVEVNCQLDSGNLTVSWMPPMNARGQLLNYSIAISSYSKYINQSGQWTTDEWRSTMETADNQSLSFETGSILMPNTNYSVRVCANNRSKHCGRLSSLSAHTQCSTPAELPSEVPANIRLTTKNIKLKSDDDGDSDGDDKKSIETLALELPFISLRNGTIDCIQIVLISLPSSYNNLTATPLTQFLPSEPSDIKLSQFIELQQAISGIGDNRTEEQQRQLIGNIQQVRQNENDERAVAYLAEEIDLVSWMTNENEQKSNNIKYIMLGDGSQQTCQSFPLLKENFSNNNSKTNKRHQVFDGTLKAKTYYTGFIKLILIRPNPSGRFELGGVQSDNSLDNYQVLTKYSNYFNPVKTGNSVIEIPLPNDEESTMTANFATRFSLNSHMNLQEMATKLGSNLRVSIRKLYNSTSMFVADNFKLDAIGDFIMHSSPLMRILEVGVIVFVLSLLLLFVSYILSLPASLRRKRKRNVKRQLQKHQKAAASDGFSIGGGNEHQLLDYGNGMQVTQANGGINLSHQTDHEIDSSQTEHQQQQQKYEQQHNIQALAPIVGYQQVETKSGCLKQKSQVYETSLARNLECPIHSSPLNQNQPITDNKEAEHRSPVHMCQPIIGTSHQQTFPSQQAYNTIQHAHHHHHHHNKHANQQPQQQQQPHHHHHHHHHHQQQQQQQQQHQIDCSNQELASTKQAEQYERNCRTTRRVNANSTQLKPINDFNHAAKNFNTLNNQNSILALAKKINKSIPIRLFGTVFECRLRNGWLKEEYEQLPRQQQQFFAAKSEISSQNNGKPPTSSLSLELRPQLIVSRNDTMSALISGNDKYDANLIKLSIANGYLEKKIICARSPLDADSVWDFWRLIYEQDVNTIVMLTQNEDPNTGETRCAQYWPTCDNEETTILSPCNEFVQKSSILPAKFKIRQETFEEESREDNFKVRRLTLMVMATRPGENDDQNESKQADSQHDDGNEGANNEEELLIVERNILHLQYYYWNTSNLSNQMRLIKFIEMANERHSRSHQEADPESPSASVHTHLNHSMLVHCFNGLGRSGLFTAMSFIIDDLSFKLNYDQQKQSGQQQQPDHRLQKLNIFQLVSRLRSQRDMLVSPYRLYELLYQLVSNCIPAQEHLQPTHIHTEQCV